MTPGRLNALTDGVVAIVLTIMVLELKFPAEPTLGAVLKVLPFGLDQAAVEAVKKWKFKPGTLNGQPFDVIFNLTVNFKLN